MSIKEQAEKYTFGNILHTYNDDFCVGLAGQRHLTAVQRYIAKHVISQYHPYLDNRPKYILRRLRNEANNGDDYHANLNTLAFKYLASKSRSKN